MSYFTVEAVTAPVADEAGWDTLRSLLDTVPGTVLIEDADEPMLIFCVDAASPLRAIQFVEGIRKIADIEIIRGEVYEAPEIDFERPDAVPEAPSKVVAAVQSWVDSTPDLRGRLKDGELLDA